MRDEPGQHDSNGLAAALADYLTRIDRGEAVCRETFLAKHPDHVASLRDYFADVDLIERLSGASSNASLVATPPIPREFGDYELLGEIGRGGMGIVYRAQELSTGRLVALKMLLHGMFMSAAEVRRFRNEARTAAGLAHDNIMPIYHVGEHQGHLFYTMPWIQGINLAQRIAAGPLDPRVAARLLLTVAEAVAFAHSRGVVHRDLKPANILLDEHERPYVADFGLARQLGEDPHGITLTGDVLGTPNYMAPEQVNGHHALIGIPADVYAMGAVLYALLVGQPPFQSNSIPATLQKICSTDPVPPRQIRRGVPRDLETICLKCLEKSPANRYRSAQELADDLRRFLAGEPLFAQRVSRIERARRWFVRNPVVGTLAVGIALALIAGTGFSLYYAAQAREGERQALANLYAADMDLAQQHMQSGAVASALRLLERHHPPPGSAEQPSWEWRHLWQQCHGELRRFEGPQGAAYAAAFSPDGRTVAAAGADHIVWVWKTATGDVIHKLAGHAATIRDLAFSPDGRRLATVGDDCVGLVWDTTTGEQIATLSGHERPLTTVAFSADGNFIATGGNDETKVNLWDAATRVLRQSLDLGPAESLAFAPSDAQIAIAGRDGYVRVCQPDERGTWAISTTILGHTGIVYNLAWSPHGARLATAGADRAVKLWDTNSWRELATIGPFKESVYGIRFSPDGRRLAAAARNEPLKVWDLDRSQFVTELLGHSALVTALDYDPAGWRLISASEDGTVRLWDAAQSTDHDRLEGHLGHVRTVAFSSSRNVLATGGTQDGAIILWNSINSRPVRVFQTPACAVSDLAFSPDGKSLASVYVSGLYSSRLRIWDVESDRETLDLALDAGPLVGVAWVPDGDRIAVQSDDGAFYILEADSGRQVAKWSSSHDSVGSIAFNNDGSLLATCTDQSVRVWQTSTQSLVHELQGHTAPVMNAVFNPAGTLIASASNDHSIRLWDAATGQHLRTLTGHGGTPFGLAFSADGTRLASSSADQTVKLWDVATGLELQSLVGHADWARDVAFSPDGQQLASAGYDGTVRIWHAPFIPPPRSDEKLHSNSPPLNGEGLGEGFLPHQQNLQAADWATTREAAALVKHLAAHTSARESLVVAIEADQTIHDAVRTAAINQAEGFLFFWEPMLAGHRAAERRDWAAAIDAFDRVATLAPGDVMHWYWLAMASLAADRPDTYQRACDSLLRLCAADASDVELFWGLRTWLVASHSDKELAPLGPLVGAFRQDFPEPNPISWLYKLRGGKESRNAFDSTMVPISLGPQPDDWYVLAMAWLRLGDKAQTWSAYQTGVRQARSASAMNVKWDSKVYWETLRREVEDLLAAEASLENAPPSRATTDPASPSDLSPVVEPAESVPSGAPK